MHSYVCNSCQEGKDGKTYRSRFCPTCRDEIENPSCNRSENTANLCSVPLKIDNPGDKNIKEDTINKAESHNEGLEEINAVRVRVVDDNIDLSGAEAVELIIKEVIAREAVELIIGENISEEF